MIKITLKDTPREFNVGDFTVKDHGEIFLSTESTRTNEMLAIVTDSGKRCDISATKWGLYLGPSLNSRLKNEGFKSALVHNKQGQLYLMAVDNAKLAEFATYIEDSELTVLQWLDEWKHPES